MRVHVVLRIFDGTANRGYQVRGQLNFGMDQSGVLRDAGHHVVFGYAADFPIALNANITATVGLGHGVLLYALDVLSLADILHPEEQTCIIHPNHFSERKGMKSGPVRLHEGQWHAVWRSGSGQQPCLCGERGGFGSVCELELRQDVGNMSGDGCPTNYELGRDHGITRSLGKETQYLDLPCG